MSETMELCQVQGAQSVQTIVQIRDDPEAPYHVRLKAADILRGYMPAQIEGDGTSLSGIRTDLLPFCTKLELDALLDLHKREAEIVEKIEERRMLKEQGQLPSNVVNFK